MNTSIRHSMRRVRTVDWLSPRQPLARWLLPRAPLRLPGTAIRILATPHVSLRRLSTGLALKFNNSLHSNNNSRLEKHLQNTSGKGSIEHKLAGWSSNSLSPESNANDNHHNNSNHDNHGNSHSHENYTQRKIRKLRQYLPYLAAAVAAWAIFSYLFYRQIKEFVAWHVGDYLTRNSRFTVVFEEASILPGWNRIYFKKCFISRRPKVVKQFVKGSQQAAIDNAIKDRELDAIEGEHDAIEGEDNSRTPIHEHVFDDGNYTQYDLNIDEINLSLSFTKWFNSKGILKDVELKGVRGVVDRTHVHWDPDDDARNWLNKPSPNDLNIENFTIEDFLVTLHQPNNFRPFNISIYNCNLSKLRQNWLLIDFLTANNINGSYDGSLFTINKIHDQETDEFFTRCRIDGLNVDHLNAGVEGPFGWIIKGRVDMLGDIRIPNNNYKLEDFFKIVKDDIVNKFKRSHNSKNNSSNSNSATQDDYEREYKSYYHENDKFFLKLRIQLNNVKARIPLFTNDLSYINYALMRPIVGYINSRQTYVAIHCDVVKAMRDFNGSWTVYDSLLMDDISNKVYEEFGNYVIDEEQKSRRLKKIGFWTLQIMLQVFLFGLSSIG